MGGAPRTMPSAPRSSGGLSTGKKVALLAGAAALYYMYKKNKEKRAQGDQSQPQYYLSKNGRVYYRDQRGQAHWVTPPQQGIQVPYDEAQEYSRLEGYNRGQGMSLQDLMNQGGVPVDDPYAGAGGGYGAPRGNGGYGGGYRGR